jgi:PilZ domain
MAYDALDTEAWISPDPEIAQSSSKRKENRQRVLLRAQVHVVRLQSDLLVTDISRSGLRGATDINLRVGQTAFISLDDLTHVAGSIRWIQDGRFGMKFSKMLDVLPACAHVDLGHLPDHQERMPRTATRLKARLSLSSWSSAARIRNVSKTGMMIETDLPVIPEQQLLINLSDGKIFDAEVKWVEGDRVGIQLATAVSILHLTYGDLR